jgi:hypothetical protein
MLVDAAASDSLPLAYCPSCEATAVTYRAAGAGGVVEVFCLSCGGRLGRDGEVEELLGGAALLEALGLSVSAVRPSGMAGGCRTGGGACGCSKSGGAAKKTRFQA